MLYRKLFVMLALVALLSACGGDGDTSTPTPTGGAQPQPTFDLTGYPAPPQNFPTPTLESYPAP